MHDSVLPVQLQTPAVGAGTLCCPHSFKSSLSSLTQTQLLIDHYYITGLATLEAMVSGARSSWFTATEWHAENLSAGSEPRPGPGYGMTEPESESDQPVSSEQGRAFSGDCD